MTTKLENVDDLEEILNRIEGYASSALRRLPNDPRQSLGFIKSQAKRGKEILKDKT